MQLLIKLIISLAWLTALCVNTAHARRVVDSQELMQKPKPHGQLVNQIPTHRRVWEPEISQIQTWQQFSKPVRDAEYSKFVIDINSKKIYFLDANVFILHSDFVLDYLLKIPRTTANIQEYNRNYSNKKPNFILGYLTHYPKLNEWTFSFWEGDTIEAEAVAEVATKLSKHFKLAPLKFRPDSSYQERMAKDLFKWHVPIINNATLYQAMPFQAFNTGEAVGKLSIVPASQKIENLTFSKYDIVILQQSYPDISPVSGIITTQFSTPLSHVNLRANAWGIPNAGLKTAANDYKHLQGQWVKFKVSEQALYLEKASDAEIAAVEQAQHNTRHVQPPQADLNHRGLNALATISLKDATRYGAKTAHLGVMMQSQLPVPDGFGVPFYYYQEHLRLHGLDKQLAKILQDKRFNDVSWRKLQLLAFQKRLRAQPIQPKSMLKIKQQWLSQLDGEPVFARSSTNAEDLAGFNGAGLYDSVPNIQSAQALEAGIKQVWASLWNLRAVEERTYFGIPQTQVYASVLIQAAVEAKASGVLLTTDIWGHQPDTFTINAKWGLGMRVVEGQKIAEQILYDTSNHGTRVISRSDETTMLVFDEKGGIKEVNTPKATAIITEKRAKLLGSLALKVQSLFLDYGTVDIEWVLGKDFLGRDQFWVVQARPYVDN
jgi:pyruvate, water dikinase